MMEKLKTRRTEYLESFWKPFPTASPGALALDEWPQTNDKFITRGRIIHFEKTAQISHITLSGNDKVGEVQVPQTLELENGFRVQECLEIFDIIEVLCQKSKAGIYEVQKITLLVPTQGPSPLRQPKFDVARAHNWEKFLSHVRGFFNSRGFLELRTPSLVPSPGLEPFLDPFETTFHMGQSFKKLYLPTSPEFHLKKAVSHGFEKIFEFKECFRNGELSNHHQPEFLMLEWYRAYKDNSAIINDCRMLIELLQKEFLPQHSPLAVKLMTMEELWKDVFDFDLTPDTHRDELEILAEEEDLGPLEGESFDDLFARLFVTRCEEHLKNLKIPVIVWHFPPSQAALARLTPDGWADRFELYWKGLEIANAFHELNDVNEQRRRFEEDQKKKASLDKKIVPIDEELMQSLEFGMPPTAGIALGMERLFMALLDLKEMDEVRMFPLRN